MTRSRRSSVFPLLLVYARPFWPLIAWLAVFAVIGNLVIVLQPLLLAALLSVLIPGQAPPAADNFFNLNLLGARVLEWLGLNGQGSGDVFVLAGLLLAQAIMAAGLSYAAYLTALRIRSGATRLIQEDLLRHLLALDLRFFHRQKSGELMSRITQDAVNMAQGLGPLLRGLTHESVQLVCYGLFLWHTSAWLTVTAVAIIAVHFLLTRALKRPLRTRTREAFDAQAEFSTALQETLTGVRASKSFGTEQFALNQLSRAIQRTAGAVIRQGRIEKFEAPARNVLDTVGLIGILAVALLEVKAGRLTPAGLLIYLYIGRLIITPANQLATTALWVQSLSAASERIIVLFAERPSVKDGSQRIEEFHQEIMLQDVSFSYGAAGSVLQHVTVQVRRGEMLAIVGPSGAGKSTLVDLILRLYDPDLGVVSMDGVDLRTVAQADYRKLFGTVPQETLLFHDTVRENIRFGRLLSEQQIVDAARLANAHGFISQLPQGYDTVIGDRGVRLSGGERQRIALARAIAHRPQILILDEATSALDSESERLVQEALESITRHTTTIVIAHRLSTILHADMIVVMDRGRVVDCESHGVLLQRCSLYRRLCELQWSVPVAANQPASDGVLS